jgi:hypothetical protein
VNFDESVSLVRSPVALLTQGMNRILQEMRTRSKFCKIILLFSNAHRVELALTVDLRHPNGNSGQVAGQSVHPDIAHSAVVVLSSENEQASSR